MEFQSLESAFLTSVYQIAEKHGATIEIDMAENILNFICPPEIEEKIAMEIEKLWGDYAD